jgi:hypothetical protein
VPPRHHESQTVFDDRRIALAAAGIRPVNGATRKSQTFGARCRFTVEIQVSHSGCGCFGGLPVAALSDDTHRGASDASRRDTLSSARQSSDSSGCDSERQGRNDAAPGISLVCSPTFLRGHRASPDV